MVYHLWVSEYSAPIAISLTSSSIPVLSVIGDGGFLMYLGELETAKRVAAHVLYVVFGIVACAY